MAAKFTSTGRMLQLARQAEPPEPLTEEDVRDAGKLARRLVIALKDIADMKRRFWPRRIDFEDREVDDTGTTKYRFEHGFGGRVRWWPTDTVGGPAYLERHTDTDNDTLVLVSHSITTVTVRVEEAG